jgi:acyl CoA:acetate/3-ketoacid CoA transferase beta subunit
MRAFVERLDFTTSVPWAGGTTVITDLGVLEAGDDRELVLTTVHPGVSVDDVRGATGSDLRVAGDVAVAAEPTPAELDVLRDMMST